MIQAIAPDKAIFEADGKRYVYADLLKALRDAGLRRGDTVFVHSDLKSFGKLVFPISRAEYIESFIGAFVETIGPEGNLILPTFSYSFTKKEVFDPLLTPSTVGVMSEHFRTLPGVLRSLEPIFSVAAIGPDSKFYTDVSSDCFGKGSIHEKLYERDARLVFLGQTFDITYMHFVEQRYGVSYRYRKKFSGDFRIKGQIVPGEVEYNVRALDQSVDYDLEGIASRLDAAGVLKKSRLGDGQIRVVSAVDAYRVIWKGLEQNVRFLLKPGVV